ncbi:twin-arginine translocase subunit TatC [Halorarius halobius]|uniref:twin-arginine translocase subunit TatC n=1 Tax=Halorarius halobius TaxID=2962671 RepID=UPI0020CC44B4|nr:twin-arginine translocase subunit TatC [Halorarius halobius]
MAEEPGDDREGRDSTDDAGTDTDESADPDAHDDGSDDVTDAEAVDEAGDGDDAPASDAPGDEADDDAPTSGTDAPDDAPAPNDDAVATDEEFNRLHADDVEFEGEAVDPDDYPDPVGEYDVPDPAEEDPNDLHERYGMPESDVSEEERAEMEAMSTGEAGETADTHSDGGYADDNPYADYDDYQVEETTVHEGAPDDQEMPLADHIEEMVKRLGVVVVVMAVVSGIVFPFGTDLINFLWYSYLPGTVSQCPEAAVTAGNLGPGDAACPRVYHPLAVILARLKVATLVGFLVALPVFVYQTYLFMRPGLYPKERRYYLASVPTSLLLATAGVAFAHFLVIPAIFTYFVYYSDSATTIAFGLTETFDLMVLMMGGFAIVFQIPLFIMLALMMGLVTRRWIADRRLIFWGVYAGLAFLFSPDPTGMAPIIVAATMIVLHEGTLLLAKWTGRG